jgi:hypothetical protein
MEITLTVIDETSLQLVRPDRLRNAVAILLLLTGSWTPPATAQTLGSSTLTPGHATSVSFGSLVPPIGKATINSLTISPPTNSFGDGTTVTPTGNPLPTLSTVNVQTKTGATNEREYMVNLGLVATTGLEGNPATGATDKVALFVGTQGNGTRAGNLWAENPVVWLDPTFAVPVGHHQVSELDMVNGYKDVDNAPGPAGVQYPNPLASSSRYPYNIYTYGIIAESSGLLNTAAFVAGGSSQWRLAFLCDGTNAVSASCFTDYSTSRIALDVWGSHTTGVDFTNATISGNLLQSPNTELHDNYLKFGASTDPRTTLGQDEEGALILGSTAGTANLSPHVDFHRQGLSLPDARLQTNVNGALDVTARYYEKPVTFRFSPTGLVLPNTTVSQLPPCNSITKYSVYVVSDASSPSWNSALSGGGSTEVIAFCNGTTWTAH